MPQSERPAESYLLAISHDDDGTWRVTMRDFPEVTATGRTEKEMQDNLVLAFQKYQASGKQPG